MQFDYTKLSNIYIKIKGGNVCQKNMNPIQKKI